MSMDFYVDEAGHILEWAREDEELSGGWKRADTMSPEEWVKTLCKAQDSKRAWYIAFMRLATLPLWKRLFSWEKFARQYEDMGFSGLRKEDDTGE